MILFSWLKITGHFFIPISFKSRWNTYYSPRNRSSNEGLCLGDRIKFSQYLHILFNQRLILFRLRGKLAEEILLIACNLINTK